MPKSFVFQLLALGAFIFVISSARSTSHTAISEYNAQVVANTPVVATAHADAVKAAPAPVKAAPVKEAAPVQKEAAPAKEVAPVKAEPAKEAAPVKKGGAPAKEAVPVKTAPVKEAAPVKAAPAKAAAPVKAAPAKEAAPVKAAPAKEAAPVKAAPAKEAAPVKAEPVKAAPAKAAPAKAAPVAPKKPSVNDCMEKKCQGAITALFQGGDAGGFNWQQYMGGSSGPGTAAVATGNAQGAAGSFDWQQYAGGYGQGSSLTSCLNAKTAEELQKCLDQNSAQKGAKGLQDCAYCSQCIPVPVGKSMPDTKTCANYADFKNDWRAHVPEFARKYADMNKVQEDKEKAQKSADKPAAKTAPVAPKAAAPAKEVAPKAAPVQKEAPKVAPVQKEAPKDVPVQKEAPKAAPVQKAAAPAPKK